MINVIFPQRLGLRAGLILPICFALLLIVHPHTALGAPEGDAAPQSETTAESNDASSTDSTAEGDESAITLPDVGEALQLDERLGSLVEEQFTALDHPALSTSLIGRLTAASIVLVLGLCLLKLNSLVARRVDRGLNPWRDKHNLADDRLHTLFVWVRWSGYTVGLASVLYCAEVVVGDGVVPGFLSKGTRAIVENGAGVAVVVLIVLLIWEGVNAGIERVASRDSLQSSARAQTLLPVVRNVTLFTLMLMASLVVLSELGIEIMPILAGAGVVGIAIGFGAQTLVKDFLTGFTIIIEDLLQIGDVVSIADRTGAVKRITLRKIELRALDVTVNTIPYSAIDIVDNLTKEYSYYLMDIGVAYKENTDAVVECLNSIDEELRGEEAFSSLILAPLEVLGVDQFADSAVIIKARIKTSARDKWRVGREFNRRMKLAFDEAGIEIPFPHRTLFVNGDTQKLAVDLDNGSETNASGQENSESDRQAA
ncbi:MAG: hypothetical protein Cons2KO_12640 [Congregibacter sp.]